MLPFVTVATPGDTATMWAARFAGLILKFIVSRGGITLDRRSTEQLFVSSGFV